MRKNTFYLFMSLGFFAAETLQAYTLSDYISESTEVDSSTKAAAYEYEASVLTLRKPETVTAIRLFSDVNFSDDSLPVANPTFQGSRTTSGGASLGLTQQSPFGLNWSLSQNIRKTKIFGTTALPLTNYWDFYPMAEVTVPLWRNRFGSEVRAQRDSLDDQSKIQNIQAFIEKESNLINIERSYYRYGIQQNLLELAKKNLNQSEKLFQWVAQRRNRNLVDDSDSLQAKASLSLRKLEFDRADRDLRVSLAEFNSHRKITDGKTVPQLELPNLDPSSFKTLASKKKISLYEKIRTLQYEAQKDQALVEAESVSPKLDLKGSFILQGRDTNFSDSYQDMKDEKRNRWQVGLSFNAPLDISLTHNLTHAVNLAEKAAAERLKRSSVDIELSWIKEQEDLLRCAETVVLLRDLESAQRSRFASEERKYRNGRSTLFLVLTAEQDLVSAESQKWSNELQCRIIQSQARLYSEEG
jgi:outer membrane protein TolC